MLRIARVRTLAWAGRCCLGLCYVCQMDVPAGGSSSINERSYQLPKTITMINKTTHRCDGGVGARFRDFVNLLDVPCTHVA